MLEEVYLDITEGIQLFYQLKVPLLGIVDNMEYFVCNHNEKYYIFGKYFN